MPLITVNGIELYYESHGSGAPLVMIGGLGQDVSEMCMLTVPLAGKFRVIALDNRGAGQSAKPAGPYSVEQLAGDVAGLLDKLDVPRAHVAGMSLGGRIALALALGWPGKVDRLVLIATGPRTSGKRWRVRAGMMVASLPGLRGIHRQPRYAMKAQFDASTRFDCTDRLGQIAAPTLILHGTSDRLAPVSMAGEMAASIPGSALVTFGGGHLAPMMTQHQRVVSEIGAFLSASPATPG